MKKALLIVAGVISTCLLGLWVAGCALFSVGHINFSLVRGDLAELAKLAHDMPLTPGEAYPVRLENGKLVPTRFGQQFLMRKPDGRLFMKFDRGGGHLGMQGYIYSADAGVEDMGAQGIILDEAMEIKRVGLHWWSYDNLQD